MKRWLAALSVAVLAAGLVACRGGDDAQPPLPTPAATPEATATPVPPSASRVGSPPPTPKPTFEPSPDARRISGLFSDPRPAQPDLYRVVETKPPETFSPWNGSDVVLYDIEAMTETNFGPGFLPGFTRDGASLYWTTWDQASRDPAATGELFVVELATAGKQRALGPARYAIPGKPGYLEVMVRNNEFALVSIADGQRTPLSMPPSSPPPATEAGGFRLEAIQFPPPYPFEYTAYRLTNLSGQLAPLEFQASRAVLTPDGALFVVTPASDLQPEGGIWRGRWGTSNIFEVDPRTGIATLIASARASVASFPVAMNEHYIVWTENYCDMTGTSSVSNGRTRIYDRQTKSLTELDQGFFIAGLTPRNELAIGSFGADALLNLDTLRYTVVFPERDRAWSDGYRYAAVGITTGHGGNCGT